VILHHVLLKGTKLSVDVFIEKQPHELTQMAPSDPSGVDLQVLLQGVCELGG